MRKKIKTRKQIIESLNRLDVKSLDNASHFYDVRTLFESNEDKLTAEDKNVLKNMLNTPNVTADDVAALMDARLKEESMEESYYPEEVDNSFELDMEEEGIDFKRINSYSYEINNPRQLQKALALALSYDYKEAWIETARLYLAGNPIDESLNESNGDTYDYFAVYEVHTDYVKLYEECPDFAAAKEVCKKALANAKHFGLKDIVGYEIKGVSGYGAGYFEEDSIELVESLATEDKVEVPYTLEYFVEHNGFPIRREEIQSFAGDLVMAAEKRIVKRFPGVEVDLSGVDRWTGKTRFESRGWLIIPSSLYTPDTIRKINKIFTQQSIYLSDEEQTLYIEDAYEDEN